MARFGIASVTKKPDSSHVLFEKISKPLPPTPMSKVALAGSVINDIYKITINSSYRAIG